MSAPHPTAEALERSLTRVRVAVLPDRGLLLADQMRQDAEIALLHLADCQCGRPGVVILRTPEGERSNGGPRCWSCAERIVREYRSKLGETWTVEDPHATTPPADLRVVVVPWEALGDYLAATGGAIGDLRLTDAPLTLAAAKLALGASS